MLYTAVVNLDKKHVSLYENSENFKFSPNHDDVIKEATVERVDGVLYISGKKRRYTLLTKELVLTEDEYSETIYRKSRFERQQRVKRNLALYVPFMQKELHNVYVFGSGLISLEKHDPIKLELPLSKTTIANYTEDK
jgi:hypothetical protein